MNQPILLLIRCPRAYLWPFICTNCLAASLFTSLGARNGAILGLGLCLLASYGFVINDLIDRGVDTINAVGRLSSAGVGTQFWAVVIATCFLISGFLVCSLVGTAGVVLCIGLASGLTMYSLVVRKWLLLANILSSALATSPLWAPLVLGDARPHGLYQLATVMFVMILAREIILDARDMQGDQEGGRTTIATIFGRRTAVFAATMVVALSGVMLMTIVISKPQREHIGGTLLLAAVAIVIVGCQVYPLIVLSCQEWESRIVSRYVLASRWAMGLVPVLVIGLAAKGA